MWWIKAISRWVSKWQSLLPAGPCSAPAVEQTPAHRAGAGHWCAEECADLEKTQVIKQR